MNFLDACMAEGTSRFTLHDCSTKGKLIEGLAYLINKCNGELAIDVMEHLPDNTDTSFCRLCRSLRPLIKEGDTLWMWLHDLEKYARICARFTRARCRRDVALALLAGDTEFEEGIADALEDGFPRVAIHILAAATMAKSATQVDVDDFEESLYPIDPDVSIPLIAKLSDKHFDLLELESWGDPQPIGIKEIQAASKELLVALRKGRSVLPSLKKGARPSTKAFELALRRPIHQAALADAGDLSLIAQALLRLI